MRQLQTRPAPCGWLAPQPLTRDLPKRQPAETGSRKQVRQTCVMNPVMNLIMNPVRNRIYWPLWVLFLLDPPCNCNWHQQIHYPHCNESKCLDTKSTAMGTYHQNVLKGQLKYHWIEHYQVIERAVSVVKMYLAAVMLFTCNNRSRHINGKGIVCRSSMYKCTCSLTRWLRPGRRKCLLRGKVRPSRMRSLTLCLFGWSLELCRDSQLPCWWSDLFMERNSLFWLSSRQSNLPRLPTEKGHLELMFHW